MTDFLAFLEAATPAWHDRAACRGHGDLFFPTADGERERRAPDRRRVAAAKAICAGCPVRGHCYSWAEAGDEWRNGGVWAGLTAKDRGQHELRPTMRRAS